MPPFLPLMPVLWTLCRWMVGPLLVCCLPWHSRVHRCVLGRRALFTGILALSPAPALIRQHSHFSSFPKLLMHMRLWATAWSLCGQGWVTTWLCRGHVRWGAVVHGGVHRKVGAGCLFWDSELFPWVVIPGVLLGVPSCLVAVTCALPGVVPACCVLSTRCAAVARRGLLSAPVPGVWAVRGVAGVGFPAVVCCVSCFDTVCCALSAVAALSCLYSKVAFVS